MVKPADVPKIKGIHLKYKGFDWTLTPYRSLPADSKAGYLVAYNWVQTAEEEEEANMTVKWLTIRGLSLPVLQNCVPLSKHDALVRTAITPPEKVEGIPPSKKRKTK